MSACHPPTPRTPLATEPNTPYCPINAVDPDGLVPVLSDAAQSAFGAGFLGRFAFAVVKARERFVKQGYRPFKGYPLKYNHGIPDSYGPVRTCRLSTRVNYNDLLNGKNNVVFDIADPETDQENFQMRSVGKNKVLINSSAKGSAVKTLTDLIMHEMTHTGLSRKKIEPTSMDDVHPDREFGQGVDAVPVP